MKQVLLAEEGDAASSPLASKHLDLKSWAWLDGPGGAPTRSTLLQSGHT